MQIVDFKKVVPINWNDFYILIDAQTSTHGDIFEITPEDFLMFAKENIKINNTQNLVDALSKESSLYRKMMKCA